MQLTCSHCRHFTEYTHNRPRFCGYCGRAFDDVAAAEIVETAEAPKPLDAATGLFSPTAETLAPRSGSGSSAIPVEIGGYRVLRRLGSGGMGSVHEAEHLTSGQKVALKLINPEFLSPQAVERFRLEGRLASSIAHPRCVFVLAADEENGQPYIIMELMPGNTLADVVAARGPLAPKEAIHRIRDVIDGLLEAHRLGVIHRDVKPSNCFIDADDRVKVGDFGLAKSPTEGSSLTQTGSFVGTVLFASPEQIKCQPLDIQADVYSVCATLYFLLTGKAPFHDTDVLAATARIVSDDPPLMRTHRPELPEALDRVVLRGLERDKSKRWQDLTALRAALLPFLPGQLSVGGLGYRFGACLTDIAILLVLLTPIRIMFAAYFGDESDLSQLGTTMLRATLRMLLLSFCVYMVYFGVLEGWRGWSPGKWFFGLRVCAANGVDPPGLARSLWRSFVFYHLRHVDNWMFVIAVCVFRDSLMVPAPGKEIVVFPFVLLSVVQLLGMALAIALPVVTMRKRNGYRGLHELLSGTRVVQLPQKAPSPAFASVSFAPRLLRPPDLPVNVGPYVILGAWCWSDDEKMLLGEDTSLGRQVLIWLRPVSEPALDPGRRAISRPTRIRWVASGSDADWQWDAFLVPIGSPLPEAVAQTGRVSWSEASPLLVQLADELTFSSREETLPQVLSAQQVWVDTYGRLQLNGGLVLSGHDKDSGASVPRPTAQRALPLLADAAALMLEGRSRPAGSSDPIRAPLPRYAAAVLNRLWDKNRPYQDAAEFRAALRELRQRPTEVTRQRRFIHLAALMLLGLFAGGFPIIAVLYGPMGLQMAYLKMLQADYDELKLVCNSVDVAALVAAQDPGQRILAAAEYQADRRLLEDLEYRIERTKARQQDWVQRSNTMVRRSFEQQNQFGQARVIRPVLASGLSSHAIREDARRHLERDPFDTEAGVFIFFVIVLVAVPVTWTVWAPITRGGLSLRWSGIELVQADGRRASRFQCLLRAILFWLPVAIPLVLSMWLDRNYWSNWYDDELRQRVWMPWLSWILSWTVVGILVAYLVRTLWSPERSWHDRIVGTWLVPR